MGSKGGSTTTSTQKLPKEFLEAYKNSLKMAGQAVATPYEAYQGQLVAGLNPTQLQGISNVNSAQGMALPAISEGIDLSRKSAQGITPELYNQFYSPYVRDVADATQRNLLESNAQQSSGLKSGAIQAGAFGGDRGGVAQAEMARQQDLANGQTMSNVYNQGYGQAMQLAGQQAQNYGTMGQQIAGLGVGAQGSVLQGAQAQMAAGAQQQATEQGQLSAAYDQWMQRLAYPYQQAQFYANIAQGLGSSAGGTSSTTTPGPSWGSQILGGLGALGSIFSMSDERMKEDIQPIGELFDGQTIYRYRFKGDPKGETRIGLMAQDVEKRKPRAVAEIDGMKGVDYEDATEDAATMASAGGLVPARGGRMPFADGGLSFYPYGGHRGWVGEGKIEGGGGVMGIPDAPKPYEPEDLGEDWYGMKPLTEDQVAGLGEITYKLGIRLPNSNVYARGGLARARYAGGGSASEGVVIMPDAPPAPPSNEEVDAYVAKAAIERGIDPEVAVRLWHAEGRAGDAREAWRSKGTLKSGKRESSYSPFQLNVEGGVGEEMIRRTGVDPSKVENWKPSVDFALDWGKDKGWSDWMGAKAIGLAPREGLDGARAVSASAGKPPGGVVPYDPPEMVIEGEKPKGLRRFIAGDDNQSIIESVMGRRMSPEARNAVMNASFALLAGRSPYFGVNLGQAGKVGMSTYYNALGQKRDMIKQIADQQRQGFEAETGRQQVEVQDAGQRRQLAAFIVPLIQTYMATGNPVPPQLMRMLNDAYPEGTPERANIENTLETTVESKPLGETEDPVSPIQAPAAPEAPTGPAAPGPAPIPPSDNSESVTPNAPAAPAAPSAGEDRLKEIYSGVPQSMNPYYWDQRATLADQAAKPEIAQQYREKAAEIRKVDAERRYILVNGKRVPYPGALEQKEADIINEETTKNRVTSMSDQTKRSFDNIKNVQTASNSLDSAARLLQTASTGQFSDVKSNIVTMFKSLGVPTAASELDQATTIQELRKVFSNILFSGGLKDKIGSQIAATELNMFAKGFGDVDLEPGANRYILGTMRGLLRMENQRAQDWIAFAENNGNKPLSTAQIAAWENDWNAQNPVSNFVKTGIASTPAAGEVDWARFNSDPAYAKFWREKFTPGYQYVMPVGKVKVYTGRAEDKYFAPVDGAQ